MLKKDSFILGCILGFVLPLLFFALLYLIKFLLQYFFKTTHLLDDSIIYLISIFINLFSLRYYFVNLKYDKTGRAILFVTFIYMILYFTLKH